MSRPVRQVKIRSWLWTALIVFAIMVVFRLMPLIAETVYGQGLYPIIRAMLDVIHMPFSGLQAMFVALAIYFCFVLFRVFTQSGRVVQKLNYVFRSVLRLFCLLVIWFYVIWGYNYARPDLIQRMEVVERTPDSTWLFNEIEEVIVEVNTLRKIETLSFLDHLDEQGVISTDFDIDEINGLLESVLKDFKYDMEIKSEIQYASPPGFLLHWSTAGIYWPFTGQSNVDEGVHIIRKPVTIAHELAHAHGLTSEGDCNFVAYLACRTSANPRYRYSAQLSYLGYLMRDALKLLGRQGLDRFYNQMSPEVISDRQAIFDHHNQYEDYFPKLRNTVYDSYLKSQGVKGGLSSYNYFVNLKYQFDR